MTVCAAADEEGVSAARLGRIDPDEVCNMWVEGFGGQGSGKLAVLRKRYKGKRLYQAYVGLDIETEVYNVGREEWFENEYCDMSAATLRKIQEICSRVARRLGYRYWRIGCFGASWPCTTYSKMDAINAVRDLHYRIWRGEGAKGRPPAPRRDGDPNYRRTQLAEEADALVQRCLELADEIVSFYGVPGASDPRQCTYIVGENPSGALQQRPWMKEWHSPARNRARVAGGYPPVQRHLIDYCAYDHW